MWLPVVSLVGLYLMMALEGILSWNNEAVLRRHGAIEPPGDVYQTMRWAYPLTFLAIGIEGLVRGQPPARVVIFGIVVLTAAKILKFWAIGSLGARWSFRVLVLPEAPLVERGPYRFSRHPNYIAVCGEIVGAAIMLAAPLAGVAALTGFGWLLRKRIAFEERALGIRSPQSF